MTAGVRLLIVEGTTDRWFLFQFLLRRGFEEVTRGEVLRRGTVQIRFVVAGSFGQIPTAIRDNYRPDDMGGLGIVADMDSANDDGRYSDLRRILRDASFGDIPEQMPADGLVVGDTPSGCLGVWLMPNNVSDGMTESFAAEMIAADCRIWAHAQSVVAGIPNGAWAFDRKRHSDKAIFHTWMAWQADPGGSMGDGVIRRYLGVEGELAGRFCGWVDRWLG